MNPSFLYFSSAPAKASAVKAITGVLKLSSSFNLERHISPLIIGIIISIKIKSYLLLFTFSRHSSPL